MPHHRGAQQTRVVLQGSRIAAYIRYDVRIAYDGDQAIREASLFRPEVALLDIGLPGKDGYEVARHMRREQDDDVMLIAVTGYASEEDVRRSRAAGFDEHLAKPADVALLMRKIEGRVGRPGA